MSDQTGRAIAVAALPARAAASPSRRREQDQMHCFECATTDTPRDAVAICSGCGAAACPDHTHEFTTKVQSHTIGNPTVRTVRHLRCHECVSLEARPL